MSKYKNIASKEIEIDNLDLIFGDEENEDLKEELERISKNSKVKSTVIIESDLPSNNLKSPFVIAFTENLDYLAKVLTKTEFRIVFYILSIMEYGNLVNLKQSNIANILNINKSNVSLSFKKLKEKKILIQDENGNTFFNSNIIIKGLPKKLTQEKRENLKKSKVGSKDIKNSKY